MDFLSPKTIEDWKNQQRDIGRCGNAALKLVADPVAEADEYTEDISKFSRYEALAYTRFHRFKKVVEASDTRLSGFMVIRHGYMVAGRIMQHLVTAYSAYCGQHDRIGQVTELADLLRDDQIYDEFVKFLSNMPNDVNRTFEEFYGLKEETFRFYNRSLNISPFVVDTLATGELYAYPNTELEAQAYMQNGCYTRADFGEYERCPATDVLLRNLWNDMIDEGSQRPDLFAADLHHFVSD